MSRGRSLFLAVFAAMMFAGCSAPVAEEPPATQPPATLAPATTTTTTTEAAVQMVPAPSADQASKDLLAAWRAGDREAALRVALPVAVETLFAKSPGATQGRGCDTAQLSVDCAYRLGSNLLTLKISRLGDGWAVEQVEIQ